MFRRKGDFFRSVYEKELRTRQYTRMHYSVSLI